jgi:hypothetical protein
MSMVPDGSLAGTEFEMRHLVGRDFIPATDEPSQTWLQKYIHPDDQAHVMDVISEAIHRDRGRGRELANSSRQLHPC